MPPKISRHRQHHRPPAPHGQPRPRRPVPSAARSAPAPKQQLPCPAPNCSCICIVRTITSAVDTSKRRTVVRPPASLPWAQACWLGAQAKTLCVPSTTADTPSKTRCALPEMPRAPPSALGCSAAETRAPAASGRTPPAGTHTPPNVSGPSAISPGVPPAASRASAVLSGARRKTARGPVSQSGVRRAFWAAHEAHRADLRPNGAACEVLEHGAPVKRGGTPPKTCDGPSRRRLLTLPRGASSSKRPD